jgi:hypothetical protein
MANQMMRGRPQTRPFKTVFKKIDRPEPNAGRTIGFGQPIDMARIKSATNIKDGLGNIADSIKNNMDCPIWNMPIIDQTRGTLLGPASDQTVSQFFGAEIRPFDWTNSTTGFDYVETTFAQSGEPQTHTLVCAIGWQIDVDQQVWTADGNSFTIPIVPSSEPMSPDVYTLNDLNNGQFDSPTQKFSPDVPDVTPGEPDSAVVPAFLEWGWWAQQVAWFMARGYDLQWKVGHHTNIMDEGLRHTAYLIGNAQDGSASSSEVDIARFVRRVNDRYIALGSGMYFAKIDRIRIGSTGTGTLESPNLGAFRPSRDHQRVGVTYGGGDLRSLLHGNSEFRKMRIPYVFRAGVPYGLIARVNDDTQAELMREYLSISQGQGDGSIPPIEQDVSSSILTGMFDAQPRLTNTVGSSPGTERTFDNVNVTQQVPITNAIYKGGEFKLTLAVKGFEVTDDWYNMLQNDPGIRDAIMCEVGCGWAKQAA